MPVQVFEMYAKAFEKANKQAAADAKKQEARRGSR